MSLGPGLVARETVFGWLISGREGATATDVQMEILLLAIKCCVICVFLTL